MFYAVGKDVATGEIGFQGRRKIVGVGEGVGSTLSTITGVDVFVGSNGGLS